MAHEPEENTTPSHQTPQPPGTGTAASRIWPFSMSVTSKSSFRLLFSTTIIIFMTGMIIIAVINWRMKQHAREEAKAKAMILLDRSLAIHTYFSHQLKPVVFKTIEPLSMADDFQPAWMSSTYAVREINTYYKSLSETDYYYKECAINARSPENEADPFEQDFIRRLNTTPSLNELVTERDIDGNHFFVVLRRGESMEQSCLRCHSTPDAAPKDMVAYYGPERSFNRYVGEVVSAISVRIPLDSAYHAINLLIVQLSFMVIVMILAVFVISALLSKRWVFDPLKTLHKSAFEISENPKLLGGKIPLPPGLEVANLTRIFNTLSVQLRSERDRLEDRVLERTKDLNLANDRLKEEGEERKKIISDLQSALNEIKTLKGILPICSYCNKIRDEKGQWNRLEAYISDRSDADFSHGVCPECLKTHYPDM